MGKLQCRFLVEMLVLGFEAGDLQIAQPRLLFEKCVGLVPAGAAHGERDGSGIGACTLWLGPGGLFLSSATPAPQPEKFPSLGHTPWGWATNRLISQRANGRSGRGRQAFAVAVTYGNDFISTFI